MSVSPSFTGGWNSLPPGDGWQRQDEILVLPPRGSVFPLMGFYFFNLQPLTKWTPPKDRRKREEKVKHTANTRYTHIPNICRQVPRKKGAARSRARRTKREARLGASGRSAAQTPMMTRMPSLQWKTKWLGPLIIKFNSFFSFTGAMTSAAMGLRCAGLLEAQVSSLVVVCPGAILMRRYVPRYQVGR